MHACINKNPHSSSTLSDLHSDGTFCIIAALQHKHKLARPYNSLCSPFNTFPSFARAHHACIITFSRSLFVDCYLDIIISNIITTRGNRFLLIIITLVSCWIWNKFIIQYNSTSLPRPREEFRRMQNMITQTDTFTHNRCRKLLLFTGSSQLNHPYTMPSE
jgi:hypothetical protein